MMDISSEIEKALQEKLPGAQLKIVSAGGGHFAIEAVSPIFDGKSRLESQRLILNAIRHLMSGDGAPVHAVDSIVTRPR